jgi:hypothetical protein
MPCRLPTPAARDAVDPPSARLPAMSALRFMDIFLVAVTAPVIALLGAPVLGVLVGATAWIAQRGAALYLESRARRTESLRTAIGLNLAGAMGRAWLIALTILAVGLAGSRPDGLSAAVLILVAFTIYFATSLAVRSLERSSAPS